VVVNKTFYLCSMTLSDKQQIDYLAYMVNIKETQLEMLFPLCGNTIWDLMQFLIKFKKKYNGIHFIPTTQEQVDRIMN
jgi:hypothetical protein